MIRLTAITLLLTFTLVQPALAEEPPGDDFAQYGVQLGFSPFGGSLNFNYNTSPKTSYFAAIGGLPGAELELDDVGGTDYTVQSASSWVGFFVQHRPFEAADWFRFVVGLGIGSIDNELEDADGNVFQANYNDNPVGYLGVGFGARPVKGFSVGLDIGWLQTSGPEVSQVAGTPDADALESIEDHMFFGNVLPNAQVTVGWGF